MIQNKLTPAQAYAQRIISAVDNLLGSPDDTDTIADIQMMILERPKTLRCALAAYLYKSQSAQLQRR